MPDLHIPHIDLHNRDFVLVPMNQIAPYLRHPVLKSDHFAASGQPSEQI